MKNKRMAYALAALIVIGGAAGLVVSCDEDSNDVIVPGGTTTPVTSFDVELTSSKDLSIGETITVVPTNIYPSDADSDGEFTFSSSDSSIATVDENGKITAVGSGEEGEETATITVTCTNFEGDEEDATKTVDVTVSGEADYAIGAYTYAGADYEDKLEILGKLEEYAIDNNLTGITLFESGGYVMYDDRIEKATNNYISGYGFGILTEGRFTSANTNYSDEGTEWYYHSYAGTSNNGEMNYLDDTGSTSSDLYSYMSSSYYSTRMNSTADGYEWYPSLANTYDAATEAQYASQVENGSNNTVDAILEENGNTYSASDLTTTQLNRPIALDKDEVTGLATQYRIYLKTGYDYEGGEEVDSTREDRLLYHTANISGDDISQYWDGQPVSIMDYVYPYMLLLNQNIALARSTDMISDSSDGTLQGARLYYNLTANNADILDESLYEQFFDTVGINIGLDDDPSSPDAPCITFTLAQPLSEFDAMYALSTTLVSPIPIDFIIDLGERVLQTDVDDDNRGEIIETGIKDAYAKNVTIGGSGGTTLTPEYNSLSVGPYILESSNSTEVKYRRNEDFISKFENGRYDSSIAGIDLHYLGSMSSDTNSAFNEFLEGDLDACSIPQDYLSEYIDDPRTTVTQGDSTFKLNVNSTTQDEWEAIFGTEGTNSNGGTTYNVNPLMSNDKFIQALSYGLDRETFANNRGNVPSQDYFADAYMWEPEQGYSYNETAQHIGNLADRSPETYGYNFDVAVDLMDEAIDEVIYMDDSPYEGYLDYTGGDRDDNNLGIIEISWMNTTDARDYGDEILGYWNSVFEATDAYRQGFRIEFTQDDGSTDYQEVYNKMTAGTYDLGFGSISGMTLDPLGFMEVLKSNNDAGFTLNYSGNTDEINEDEGKVIYYDGKKWSYDGLWEAANTGAILGGSDGVYTGLVEDPITITQSGTGTVTGTHNGTAIRQIALSYVKATEAAGAVSMRLATKEDAEFTVTGSYTSGDVTQTVTFSLPYSDYAEIDGGNTEVTEELSSAAYGDYIDLFIPQTLTTDMTYLDQDIQCTDLSDVYIYVTVYVGYYDENTRGTITVSSTVTVPATGSISW